MNVTETLKEFMLLPAPSGYEKEMAYGLKAALLPYADRVDIDRVGNVIAKISGAGHAGPVVMIYAHMDQLGFVVRKIENDGFIRLDRLGGVPEKALPGLALSVRAADGRFLPAVIGVKSHHATPPEEKYRAEPVTSLFADIGAVSAAEARKMGIDIGCPAVYEPSFRALAGTKVCGTAVDDRGGCACLVAVAELLRRERPACDTYLVGTVWEEFNLRGAMMACRTVKPDVAICLDVVLCGDTPDLENRYESKLGAGPAVLLYTFHGRGTLNGTIPHEGLAALAQRAAGAQGIPLQRFAALGMLTDSAYLQLEGQGVASIEMGFPARYTHSPVEVCDTADLVRLGELISAMASRIDGSFDLNRY